MPRLGCHNSLPPGGKAIVQQGYVESRAYVAGQGLVPVRLPRMVEIEMSWQPVPCGYLERHACPDCEGCRWRDAEPGA